MRATWTSAPATGLWRTCSRSRAFHGGIFADEAASTKWSGPPFSAGAPWAFRPSCGYKAGTRPHVADSSFRFAWRHRVAMFA